MAEENMAAEVEVYHVFTKSIAGFKIFNNQEEFLRMMKTAWYYRYEKPLLRFSEFIESVAEDNFFNDETAVLSGNFNKSFFVEIIAYCIMPTHLHFILKPLKEGSISIFMSNILNSYTRYFNTKHNRKGPLWEGRFKKVLVETDEQLLHLTRYLHLNPVSAYLVDNPEDWPASSYQEYLFKSKERICKYDILNINPSEYKNFVEDRIAYQRELESVKNLIIE